MCSYSQPGGADQRRIWWKRSLCNAEIATQAEPREYVSRPQVSRESSGGQLTDRRRSDDANPALPAGF
jgi:hypothetical protein